MTLWIDELDAANSQDQEDKRQMHDLRGQLERFLAVPPSRARQVTVDVLEAACRSLARDIEQTDRAWD